MSALKFRSGSTADVSKPSPLMSIPISGSLATATLPKAPSHIEPPSPVSGISIAKEGQPNAKEPTQRPLDPAANRNPDTNAGPSKTRPIASAQAARPDFLLPNEMSHDAIRQQAKRYGNTW